MPSVDLTNKSIGDLQIIIHAEITDAGALHVSGQDFGPGASMVGDETEYIASVRKEDKDRLLLALIERLYGGDTHAVRDFYDFARSKGIEASWFRWP